MNQRKKIAVLFGGRSTEHEISIITALQAISAMDTRKYEIIPVYIDLQGEWHTGEQLLDKSFYKNFSSNNAKTNKITLIPQLRGGLLELGSQRVLPVDLCFLCFHGQYGEDGCIQGLLEMAGMAYTGCGVLAASLTMNKYACKAYLSHFDIPVLPNYLCKKWELQDNFSLTLDKLLAHFAPEAFPLFVKPCKLGSSVGISRADSLDSLKRSLALAFKYDEEAIIEPCITNLMEINVAVRDGEPPIASVVEIPVASGTHLSYEDKYMRGSKKTGPAEGMASLTRHIDPSHLDASIKQAVQQYAVKAYTHLGCQGVSRFDFIYDLAKEQLYFNEVNTIPGSLSFYLWEKSNPQILYTTLIEEMIQSGLKRKTRRLALQNSIGFKVLNR